MYRPMKTCKQLEMKNILKVTLAFICYVIYMLYYFGSVAKQSKLMLVRRSYRS